MHVCVHCVVVSCGLVPAGMQSPLQLGRAEAASERGVEARAQRVSASRFVSSITLDLLSYSYIHTMGTVHSTRMVLSTQLYLSPLPYMHACCIDSITECTPYHSGVGHTTPSSPGQMCQAQRPSLFTGSPPNARTVNFMVRYGAGIYRDKNTDWSGRWTSSKTCGPSSPVQ